MHVRSNKCRDEHGTWDFGGGKLEFGETLTEAVLREVREEYGCEGILTGRVPAHDIFREQEGVQTHWVAVPFFVKVDREQVRINEQHKMDAIGWFRLDNLPSPLHSGAKKTLDAYRPYFEEQSR